MRSSIVLVHEPVWSSATLLALTLGSACRRRPARSQDHRSGCARRRLGPAGSRASQQTMQAAKLADRVQVSNAAGAGGTIGLAQLINNNKGDGNALMVSGKGMVSAIYINKSPVSLSNVTPIARLTGEYEVLVVPASSNLEDDGRPRRRCTRPIRAACPGRGGLAGGVDQLTAGMIVQAIGGENGQVQLRRVRQRRRSAGADARRPRHGRHGRLQRVRRADHRPASCARSRSPPTSGLPGVNIPTLKEQGINVEFVNWRGLMAAPGISEAQRQELIKTVTQMAKSAAVEGARRKERVARPVHGRRRVQGLRRVRAEERARDSSTISGLVKK